MARWCLQRYLHRHLRLSYHCFKQLLLKFWSFSCDACLFKSEVRSQHCFIVNQMSANGLGRCWYAGATLSLRDESSSVRELVMLIGVFRLDQLLTLRISHHFSGVKHVLILLGKRLLLGLSLNLPKSLESRSGFACSEYSGFGLGIYSRPFKQSRCQGPTNISYCLFETNPFVVSLV